MKIEIWEENKQLKMKYEGNYFQILQALVISTEKYIYKLKDGNYFVDRDKEREENETKS